MSLEKHDCSLHLSESQLCQRDAAAWCLLDYGCGLITSTYGSQPETQESVREPECKIDKIKVTRLPFETSPSLIWFGAQSWSDCDMNIYHGVSSAKLYPKIDVMPVIQWNGPDNTDASFLISFFSPNGVSDFLMSRLISFMSCY